jgi:hypothetical protein
VRCDRWGNPNGLRPRRPSGPLRVRSESPGRCGPRSSFPLFSSPTGWSGTPVVVRFQRRVPPPTSAGSCGPRAWPTGGACDSSRRGVLRTPISCLSRPGRVPETRGDAAAVRTRTRRGRAAAPTGGRGTGTAPLRGDRAALFSRSQRAVDVRASQITRAAARTNPTAVTISHDTTGSPSLRPSTFRPPVVRSLAHHPPAGCRRQGKWSRHELNRYLSPACRPATPRPHIAVDRAPPTAGRASAMGDPPVAACCGAEPGPVAPDAS